MNEVEEMYENCNIKPKQEGYCDCDSDCPYPDIIHNGCGDECSYWKYEDEAKYPPFTPEKQLELIKWLMNNPKDFFSWTIQQQGKDIKYAFYVGYEYGGSRFLEFTEALAGILNDLWQDLTEEEQQQITDILR